MNKIDEDGLRDLFIAHGAIPNKRFRKGKLNCVQLDTNSLIHDLAEITEECLLSAAGEAKPVEITEEEIIEEIESHGGVVTYIVGDTEIEEVCIIPENYVALAKAILTKLNQ